MQQSVLSRPGNDNTRIPHFLYIDDFPEYICKAIEPIFTVYRKYKVGNILSAQTLSQLNGTVPGKDNFKDEILANCVNKQYSEMHYQKMLNGGKQNCKTRENGHG